MKLHEAIIFAREKYRTNNSRELADIINKHQLYRKKSRIVTHSQIRARKNIYGL